MASRHHNEEFALQQRVRADRETSPFRGLRTRKRCLEATVCAERFVSKFPAPWGGSSLATVRSAVEPAVRPSPRMRRSRRLDSNFFRGRTRSRSTSRHRGTSVHSAHAAEHPFTVAPHGIRKFGACVSGPLRGIRGLAPSRTCGSVPEPLGSRSPTRSSSLLRCRLLPISFRDELCRPTLWGKRHPRRLNTRNTLAHSCSSEVIYEERWLAVTMTPNSSLERTKDQRHSVPMAAAQLSR